MAEEENFLQECEPCQGFKAPRAHHCKKCKRCVMKMDHHCPWINNCVGHKNHKSFTLFLASVVIGCSHAAIMKICCVLSHLVWIDGHLMMVVEEEAYIQMSHFVLLAIFFGIGLSIGVAGSVSFLLYYQLKSLLRNETGIESWIVEKALSRRRHVKDAFVYPYNLGMRRNYRQVMTWADYVGDGFEWPLVDGCDQYTLTVEQIEQKEIKRENIVVYDVSQSYDGACFPVRLGVRVCYDAPWTEEGRIAVESGDIVHATRRRKHWVYGTRLSLRQDQQQPPPLGEDRRRKGWVPIVTMDVQDLQSDSDEKKDN